MIYLPTPSSPTACIPRLILLIQPVPLQTPLQQVTNTGRQYQLTPPQLTISNAHVNLVNNQRAPITVDFRVIADAIRQIRR